MIDGLPTGTVTFLFSDVEGSTRLWEGHHEEMRTALAGHDKVMRSAIEDNGGHVFSTAGDAYSAAFARPNSALQAAITAQGGLADLLVAGSRMKVRMAVHTGSADERDDDYFGPAVNRAARIMSVGNGGQVLVSGVTAGLVIDQLPDGAELRDLGEHRLKDLSRPETIHQLVHDSFPVDDRPLRSLDRYRHNLPTQLTSFVGREEESAELAKLLAGSRMVTLAGVGGAGKTRLAIQTAAELVPEYPDGVWLVELAPLTDTDRIYDNVLSALRIEAKAAEDPADTLHRFLVDKELLLILDNCEHLVTAAARLAETALAAGSGITILATSREMLGVPGEYTLPVPSLAAPDSLESELRAALLRYPAVRLFSERGELAKRGWRLTSENAAAVVQICQRLDGMPLAIELAAARLRMMPAEQIASRLDDRFRLLTGGSRTALPRQQTLEAAIDWSHELLSDEEKTLFARLAVFMGGFTLDAAEAVCGVDPLDGYEVLEHLGHLVDKSLVQVDDTEEGGVRYRMLETLRQYARQRLAESGEVEQMRRAHAEHFVGLAEEAAPHLRGEDEAYWLGRLEAELDNLRQGIGWSLEAGEASTAQRIVGALHRFFIQRYRFVEGLAWAERAVAASDRDTAERAKSLVTAGTLAQIAGDWTRTHLLDEAIRIAEKQGLDEVLGTALNNRANAASAAGELGQAEELLRRSLDLALDMGGDPPGISIGMANLAEIIRAQGRDAEAIVLNTEAVEKASRSGSPWLLQTARGDLVLAYRSAGDLEAADAVLETMLRHIEETGSDPTPGWSHALKAMLLMDRGRWQEASVSLETAMTTLMGLPDASGFIEPLVINLWFGARLLNELAPSGLSARLLGAGDGAFYAAGMRIRDFAQDMEATRADTRALLGADLYDAEYKEGQKMDPKDANDLLLEKIKELNRA